MEYFFDYEENEVVDEEEMDGIQRYVSKINSNSKRLSLERELELGKIIKEGGAGKKEALEELIMSNMWMAIDMAKNTKIYRMSFEEKLELASLGIVEATNKYDYTLNCKFSTYACYHIKNCIFKEMKDVFRRKNENIEVVSLDNNEPMSYEEIGKLPLFNKSRERIRQIEVKAFAKIRNTYSMRKDLEEYTLD